VKHVLKATARGFVAWEGNPKPPALAFVSGTKTGRSLTTRKSIK
jgi:hypothetical protein